MLKVLRDRVLKVHIFFKYAFKNYEFELGIFIHIKIWLSVWYFVWNLYWILALVIVKNLHNSISCNINKAPREKMRKLTRYRENQNNYIHLARLLLDLSNIAIHAKKKTTMWPSLITLIFLQGTHIF